MNGITTITMPHVWHNPFADLQKTVLRKTASFENSFEDVLQPVILICAFVAAFSGILDFSFFQEFFSGLSTGSLWDSGFFKSLPLTNF